MDDFKPQTYDESVKKGHDVSEVSTSGAAIALVSLALAGALTFGIATLLITGLQKFETYEYPTQLTETQKDMKMERAGPENRAELKKALEKKQLDQEEISRAPELYSREDVEKHLARTFPAPRLQYDDVLEMQIFRESEEHWLASSGQSANGTIHIPVDHAMDLVVQQGLPQASSPFVAPTLPTAVPMVPAPAGRK